MNSFGLSTKEASSILDFEFLDTEKKNNSQSNLKKNLSNYKNNTLCLTRDTSQGSITIKRNEKYQNYNNDINNINIINNNNNNNINLCDSRTKVINVILNKPKDFYEISKEKEILRKQKINELKNIQTQIELSNMKPFIKMGVNSKEILKNKFNRSNSVSNLNSNKIDEKTTMQLKNIIEIENELLPKTTRKFEQKIFENFLKENKNFLINKENYIRNKKIENEKKNGEENYSFKPNLNPHSLFILENIDEIIENNRMIRSKSYIKKEYEKIKNQNNFTPIINKNYKSKNKFNTNYKSKKNCNFYNQNKNNNNNNKIIFEENLTNENFSNNNEIINDYNNDSINNNLEKIKESSKKNKFDAFSSLYSLNINNNMPNRLSENVIIYNKNNIYDSIIEKFI